MENVSLRSTLRARTRGLHDRLDASLAGPAGRVDDVAGYVRIVQVLHALHSSADRPLARWARTSPLAGGLDADRLPDRAPAYAADLGVLGVSRPEPDDAVEQLSDARALALLYLVSGSAAGARVLLRGLPSCVPPDARTGLTGASAASSTLLWRDVCALLSRPASPELRHAAAAEACSVLEGLLDRQPLLAS